VKESHESEQGPEQGRRRAGRGRRAGAPGPRHRQGAVRAVAQELQDHHRGVRDAGPPIILTEQYPKGLGRTVPDVLQALEGKTYERIEKVAFSCARDEAFLSAIAKTVRRQVVLIGMEAHVCVYQTSVDLVNAGYEVFVLDDAVSSRFLHNYQSGIAALRDAGAVVVSTETAVFQMMKVAGTPEFKKISSLLR
jgi:nicotinamidase-related amidase